MECFLMYTIILSVLNSGFHCNGEEFHPERTLLIDYYPHNKPVNFLFRGNMPNINGTFAYQQILTTMTSIAQKHNLSLPRKFTLIDVSYLNVFEYSDLKIEKDFFESHPNLGQLYNKVIIGSVIPPPQDDLTVIKDILRMYDTTSFDHLPDLMDFLRNLLTQPDPVVIYTHCEAGTDRTGEVSGAYYMKYLNMTFTDALSIDNHVQSRDISILFKILQIKTTHVAILMNTLPTMKLSAVLQNSWSYLNLLLNSYLLPWKSQSNKTVFCTRQS